MEDDLGQIGKVLQWSVLYEAPQRRCDLRKMGYKLEPGEILPKKVAEDISSFLFRGIHLTIEKSDPLDASSSLPLLTVESDEFTLQKDYHQACDWDKALRHSQASPLALY